jgi:copper chaperone CopZ
MKTVKSIAILTMITFLFASFANAQGLKYVKIKTSAVSDHCKELIEKELNKNTGVESASLDLETNIVTVQYSEGETSYEKLVSAINNLGYDADDSKAEKSKDCGSKMKTSNSDCGSKTKTTKSDCGSKTKTTKSDCGSST